MASSKVMMASTNSRTSDLTHHPSSSKPSSGMISDYNPDSSTQCSNHHQSKPNPIKPNLESPMTVDGLFPNLYTETPPVTNDNTLLNTEITLIDAVGAISSVADHEAANAEPSIRRQNSFSSSGDGPAKTVDDVWRDIVSGNSERKECKVEISEPDEIMTLEDFLVKAGAVDDEDVKEPVSGAPIGQTLSGGIFSFDPIQSPYTPQATVEASGMGFGNGAEVVGGVGRGKRRAGPILEPLDKAAQQRQRRMIKNRESAARSRERKQAYQFELESLAAKLEDENERLRAEKAQWTKERLKQLMEKVIPVTEKRKPPCKLSRVHSTEW